ncbi:LAMI_0F01222g1_1 [Lachancea mirantina]|uniref:LAMI_0F01222g1_1 n=1 Tax=Lachancea mirantina TaxID=1230905 RepID=A0A1G4JVT6_9SACH|nr:LAMI_0F01222g1_1 [Lachancea mirantina]
MSLVDDLKGPEVRSWTTDEVCAWCAEVLRVEDADALSAIEDAVRENNIDGQVIGDLTLDDCKSLVNGDRRLAVRFKIELNRLRSKSQEVDQTEEIAVTLQQLYVAVTEKLQEFQSQYSRLRLDVMDVMRKGTMPVQQQQQQQQQQLSQQQLQSLPQATQLPLQHPSSSASTSNQPQHDYFEGHRVVTSSSPGATATVTRQPAFNRSTSSAFTAHGSGTTPGTPGVSSNEPLKHMRASKDDSCEKILKSAMRRHNLKEQDWKQYVLVICYGDQERFLELDEKPVTIFKNLKQQGLHPAIMLRQRGDFEEVGGGLTPGGRL